MLRFSLVCVTVAALSGPAFAGACDPVESAPGVKSLPDGCKPQKPATGMKKDAPEKSEKAAAATKGHVWKVGDAEMHLGGKIIFEAGTGTRR